MKLLGDEIDLCIFERKLTLKKLQNFLQRLFSFRHVFRNCFGSKIIAAQNYSKEA